MNLMRSLADELALRNLVAQYAHLADAGDAEGFAALFTEDGSWRRENSPPAAKGGSGLPAQTYIGPTELALMITQSIVERFDCRFRHQMTDLWIEFEDDGERATGRCRALIADWRGDHGRLAMLGAYTFGFQRMKEGWKFYSASVRVLPE